MLVVNCYRWICGDADVMGYKDPDGGFGCVSPVIPNIPEALCVASGLTTRFACAPPRWGHRALIANLGLFVCVFVCLFVSFRLFAC